MKHFAMLVVFLAGCANVEAQQAATHSGEQVVLTALQTFKVDTGTYPDNLQSLISDPGNVRHWMGPYLTAMPKDAWDNDYQYTVARGQIVLTSYGKDGQPGGSGADKDIQLYDPPQR